MNFQNIWAGILASFEKMNFKFVPQEFVNNLHYMGTGMISIFAVIGVIIIVTYLINKIATRK